MDHLKSRGMFASFCHHVHLDLRHSHWGFLMVIFHVDFSGWRFFCEIFLFKWDVNLRKSWDLGKAGGFLPCRMVISPSNKRMVSAWNLGI